MGNGISSSRTKVYVMSETLSQAFELHRTAAVGVWKFCHKPTVQGLWTHITGVGLVVIAKPTYTPNVGIAGSITPLALSGVMNGDFVVMVEGNCSNATSVMDGALSQQRQTVLNMTAVTSVGMVGVGNVTLCYATQESGGDSADDYTRLEQELRQLVPVSFTPNRTMSLATQHIVLSHVVIGDAVAWTLASTCDHTGGPASSTKTIEYQINVLPVLAPPPCVDKHTYCSSLAASCGTAGIARDCPATHQPCTDQQCCASESDTCYRRNGRPSMLCTPRSAMAKAGRATTRAAGVRAAAAAGAHTACAPAWPG